MHREESDKHGKVLWSVEAALTFDADSRPPKSCASMCDILRVLALLVDVAQQGAYLS